MTTTPAPSAQDAPGSIPCPYCGDPCALLFGVDVPLAGLATYHCPECGAAPWLSFRDDVPAPVECPSCHELAGIRQVSGMLTSDERTARRAGKLRQWWGCSYNPIGPSRVCTACDWTWNPGDPPPAPLPDVPGPPGSRMQAWRAVLGDRWQGGPATLEEFEAVEDRVWHPERYPDMQPGEG